MLTLVGNVQSRALRPLWLLEELGIDFRHDPALPHSDAARAADVRGKVPVLIDGDVSIADSVAIMTYLADRHHAFTQPAGTVQRARQDAITQAIVTELDATLWMAARHSFILPPEHRLPEIKNSLRWEFSRSAAAIADMMGDAPFFGGDTPTLPDFLAAHCAGWAGAAKFPVEDARLSDHMARMQARPAFGRAMARAG